MRTIQSPGVEITERDLSLSPVIPAGTNIFMTGFSNKGPTDQVVQVTSLKELETIYGTPTNPAERYFYFSARQILNSSAGNLFVNRLPYGDDLGDGYDGSLYGALVYPVKAVSPVAGLIYRNDEFISQDFFASLILVESVSGNTRTAIFSGLSSSTISTTHLSADGGLDEFVKMSVYTYQSLLSGAEEMAESGVTSISAFGEATYNILTGFSTYTNTEVTTNLTSTSATYVLGAPRLFTLTKDEYLSVVDKSGFTNGTWSTTSDTTIDSIADFGKAGLIVLNKIQSTINSKGEGHYVALSDNVNIEPNSDHDGVRSIKTVTTSAATTGLTAFTVIPESRLAFPLSGSDDSGDDRNDTNISELIERVTYQFPDASTRKFDDSISLSFVKLRQSPFAADAIKLDYYAEELVYGSLDSHRLIQDVNGGAAKNFYLPSMTENSSNMIVMVNDSINNVNGTPWIGDSGLPLKKIRLLTQTTTNLTQESFSAFAKVGFDSADAAALASDLGYVDALFPAGPYTSNVADNKKIGSITAKLDRVFRKIENDEVFPLDIITESGLGTIYATVCANGGTHFDDTQISTGLQTGLDALATNEYIAPTNDDFDLKANYTAIFSLFDNFCSNTRKDCLFIADPLRQIFVRGKNTLVLSDDTKSFSQFIYNSLKNLFGLANSSYSCTYGNWAKVNDPFSGINVWVPFSGFAASDMANVDSQFQPWYAPAGFTRGRVTNVLSVAITPKQKERDMLYKINVNPVAFFPNDGVNIFGQKTLLRQPSAFDRINVRRLFLWLEKSTKRTTKYFIFEPNTVYTRERVVSTLKPIFDIAKNNEGLYEYIIVCDKRNNTPSVIDQNELVVDIYIKPVRASEFILVNFYATRTSTNFSEIIGS